MAEKRKVVGIPGRQILAWPSLKNIVGDSALFNYSVAEGGIFSGGPKISGEAQASFS